MTESNSTSNKLLAYSLVKSTGPVILFLHGLQTCRELFSPWLAAKYFPGYSKLTIDLQGFGESSVYSQDCLDLKAQSESVIRTLDHLGIHSIIVVGHSLGGMIGTLLLKFAPHKIKGLISIEGNLSFEDCGLSAEVDRLSTDQASQQFLSILEKLERGSRYEKQRALWIRRNGFETFYLSSKQIVRYCRNQELLNIFLNEAIARKLIIGEKSQFHSRPIGENLEIEILPDTSHFMIQEKPELTYNSVWKFITNKL
jgi:pimeloyl-ACP methyl ester carboxylesterase